MKIAVIADDLTGAAEIGGIGLSYNFKVEIAQTVNPATTADMLVINTDSRSMSETEAVAITSRVSSELKALNPQFLYKKIDSVMRGHVVAEIITQCEVMEFNRALVVPANPALGRTLVNGHYYIDDVPLHQTSFKHDPEFPVLHSHVLTRFNDAEDVLSVQPHTTTLPPTGVIIGEAENAYELTQWADHLKTDTLAVGASGFFKACLNVLHPHVLLNNLRDITLSGPILYISGSTYKNSADLIEKLHLNNGPVSYMPEALMQNNNLYNQTIANWIDEISNLLKKQGKAVMAIRQNDGDDVTYDALFLRRQMSLATKGVFEQTAVCELVIEGGSTAAAVLQELEISSVFPVQELSPGVIRNAAPANWPQLHITLKPGSYRWSDKVWAFNL
jgi:uncharacterized protein YgbK (DUF1537 family)